MTTTSITDTLKKQNTRLSGLDPAWVTFVKDHTKQLIKDSPKIMIDGSTADTFKYKIFHFLSTLNCTQDIHWIVLMINNLNDYDDFSKREFIYVPNQGIIVDLYRSFQTSMKIK